MQIKIYLNLPKVLREQTGIKITIISYCDIDDVKGIHKLIKSCIPYILYPERMYWKI